jgi:beta-lactam-binding protein with PASTA domain
MSLWDFSDTFVTFDNPSYLWDGTISTSAPTMPFLVGLELYEAIEVLQAVGIYVPSKIGYFGTFPISVIWQKSTQFPGTVLAQSIPFGQTVTVNFPITLTVSEYPVAVAFP